MKVVSPGRAGAAIVVLLGVAAAIGGCDGGLAPRTTARAISSSAGAARVGAACLPLARSGKAVSFRSDDVSLAGVELGHGATGVLLVHKSTGDVCDWLTYATELVRFGYQVLAFDSAGTGASIERHHGGTPIEADVLAAVGHLRANGVSDVVLMGAEDGAAAMIVADTKLSPPAVALVGLSPPAILDGANMRATAYQVRSPQLYVTSDDDDPFSPQPPPGRSVGDLLTDGVGADLYNCPVGKHHGTDLLIGGCGVRIQSTIHDFLDRHAPAR